MLDKFHCPGCQAELSKKNCILAEELISDGTKNRTIRITKQVPVLIRYSTADGKHWEKAPDSDDIKVIDKIKLLDIPYWSPTNEVKKGDKTQEALNKGITTVDLFFQKRNLYALALIWSKASNQMKFIITAFILRSTKMNKVHMHNFLFGGGGWNAGYLTGVIYFPSLSVETSVIELLKERVKNVSKAFTDIPFERTSVISTQSASDLRNIPSNSVDYTFIDPPFGDNLMYSELNFVWESWLKVSTDNRSEAIINRTQGKQLIFYQEAMTKCFTEFYRILKPNRWMTVEFHNSKNAVWNSIQASLNHAGFVIADVRTLNKNQGSFNQVKGASQAIKQDLIISAYKPKIASIRTFLRTLVLKKRRGLLSDSTCPTFLLLSLAMTRLKSFLSAKPIFSSTAWLRTTSCKAFLYRWMLPISTKDWMNVSLSATTCTSCRIRSMNMILPASRLK